MKKILYPIALAALFFCFNYNAEAAEFNPNNIISDQEMLEWTALSLSDIEAFLESYDGYISKHKFANYKGEMKTAAEIIFDAATNNYDCSESDIEIEEETASEAQKKLYCERVQINPKLLLVLLQKEQSLIDEKNPKPSQLDWATGYGCPDGGGCNDRWKGFGKQVNSAAIQFFDYLKHPHHYKYRAGNTYTFSNTDHPNSSVRPENNATAALYNYTPHVYYGNYNFWKLWMKYFTFNYGNNTLLQVSGEPGVWLIQNGFRRPFHTKGALTSRYDPNKIITVSKSDLLKYPIGNPIKFSQYSLVRSPRGTVFLIIDDMRRGFASGDALRLIGINPEEIINASWDDINAYTEGEPITASSTYPTGALLQDKTTGGVYYVSDGTKAPLLSAILLKTKFKGQAIIPESPEKLANYKTIPPVMFGDGELIKSEKSPAVYVIDNKKLRAFSSGEIFEKLGYHWENIIIVPQKIVDLYEIGEPISEIFSSDSEVLDSGEASEEDLLDIGDKNIQDDIDAMINP